MLWLYGLLSASFSVARCSRPMCGSARSMTSPSISSTSRSTPWAAGCCGPKLSVLLRISGTGATFLPCVFEPVIFADDAGNEHAVLNTHRLIDYAAFVRVVAHLHVALQREILAERMTDEPVVRQQTAQIRVAFKQ